MEIKRRVTKIAHSLSPQLESMNIGIELQQMCSRMEELIRYGQEKIDRSAEKKETIGAKVARQRAELQKEIEDHQEAENAENLADQKESERERQLRMMKSKKPEVKEDLMTEMEIAADEEAAASREERGVTEEEDEAALAEEVKPAKKKKRKKRRSSR